MNNNEMCSLKICRVFDKRFHGMEFYIENKISSNVGGSINPTLCIQFIGFVGAFALLFTLSTIFGKWCDVDVSMIDTSTIHPSTDADCDYVRPNLPTRRKKDE